jgi:hypothetical protein
MLKKVVSSLGERFRVPEVEAHCDGPSGCTMSLRPGLGQRLSFP